MWLSCGPCECQFFLKYKIVKNIEMISKYMEVIEKEETVLSDPHTVFWYW